MDRTMRRRINRAAQKAVAKQVFIFTGLWDQLIKLCEDVNTTGMEEETDEKPWGFLGPQDLIHNILANAINVYWREKAAGEAPKKADLIQVAPGSVLSKLEMEELKRAGRAV